MSTRVTVSLPAEAAERLEKIFAEGGPEADALKAAGVVSVQKRTNLYSITRLDRWTRGVENSKLTHEQRNPKYYEYADTHTEALRQFHMHQNIEPTFCSWKLEESGVERPFPKLRQTHD